MNGRKNLVQLDTTKLAGPAGAGDSATPAAPAPGADSVPAGSLEDQAVAALRTCYDPELPVNIYELGLIYDLNVEPPGGVVVRMTLTSPGCPVADSLVREVKSKLEAIPGVTAARVELVWDPPWDQSRMSEAARLELGFF